MKIYDTLILGSGYFSAGYALARGNCAIVEEHQMCDVSFYLPLRAYAHRPYTPTTEEGRALEATFSELGLFENGMQNVNAFECAFCRYLLSRDLIPFLKSRVIALSRLEDGTYDATVESNEGLTHLYARRVLDTVARPAKRRITVLYSTKDAEGCAAQLLAAFPGASIEPAFYAERYALRIPAEGYTENTVKPWIHDVWCRVKPNAKILAIAPVFLPLGDGVGDFGYENPIEAFEAGYATGKEGAR